MATTATQWQPHLHLRQLRHRHPHPRRNQHPCLHQHPRRHPHRHRRCGRRRWMRAPARRTITTAPPRRHDGPCRRSWLPAAVLTVLLRHHKSSPLLPPPQRLQHHQPPHPRRHQHLHQHRRRHRPVPPSRCGGRWQTRPAGARTGTTGALKRRGGRGRQRRSWRSRLADRLLHQHLCPLRRRLPPHLHLPLPLHPLPLYSRRRQPSQTCRQQTCRPRPLIGARRWTPRRGRSTTTTSAPRTRNGSRRQSGLHTPPRWPRPVRPRLHQLLPQLLRHLATRHQPHPGRGGQPRRRVRVAGA